MQENRATRLIYVISVCSALALLTAYCSEYFFHIRPCALCYYQRYAIIGVLVCSVICLWGNFFRVRFWFLCLTLMSVISNFILAAYQVLVEYKLLPAPSVCRKFSVSSSNFQEFQNALTHVKKHISCEDVAWKLFGVSFAGYNVIFSLFLIAICLYAMQLLNSSGTKR